MATKKEQPPRFTRLEGTVESFVTGGWEEIQGVGEEFREIYDNAPENLQQTDLNQTRESTASSIENLSEPSVESSILGELDCATSIDNGKVYRGRQSQSRACRATNGAGQLRAAAEAIQTWLDENEALPEADVNDAESMKERAERIEEIEHKGWDVDDFEQAREEGERLVGELEEIADEVENLEYPGMFG